MISFTLGALLPLLTILLFPPDLRAVVTLVAVGLALAGTGYLSARIGGAPAGPAVRVVFGGVLAMAVTYGIGTLVGIGHLLTPEASHADPPLCAETGETVISKSGSGRHVH